jgi:hypothetical protein
MSLNNREIIKKVNISSSKLLKEKGYISIVDVLMDIGKLSKDNYEAWRFKKVPYLEKVITANLGKINLILRTVQKNSENGHLRPSKTVYKSWGKGPQILLSFSKSGDPKLENAYSTHFLKPKGGNG